MQEGQRTDLKYFIAFFVVYYCLQNPWNPAGLRGDSGDVVLCSVRRLRQWQCLERAR